MFNIDTPTSSNGKFVDGNASQGIKGTQVSADWLNMVQGEMKSVLDAASIAQNKDDNSQLLASIDKIIETMTKSEVGRFSLAESLDYSSTMVLLNNAVIRVPKGKILDLTISFMAVSSHDDYALFVAESTFGTGVVEYWEKALVIKDHEGNSRTTVRIITDAMNRDLELRVFGSWHSGDDGNFFNIEGSYRIGY